MPAQQSISGTHFAVGRDDLRRILGDVDDDKAIAILALNPSLTDLETAAIYAAGDGDVLAKSGRPLAGVAADILDILAADEEEPDPPAS
jgi:hypothetical protein